MQNFISSLVLLDGWRRYGLAFLAGALASLAQAPFGWLPLAFLSLPVFVWLLDSASLGKTAWQAFKPMALVGWSFGFGFFLATFYWLGAAFLVEADKFAWAMPLAVLVLPAGLALFWAFATALLSKVWNASPRRILWLALLLSLLEFLRGTILTGLPWGGFGQALTSSLIMMQGLGLIGPDAMTLWAILLFASPVLLFSSREEQKQARQLGGLCFLLLLGHVTYGLWQLNHPVFYREDAPIVRLVQPNIPQREKWQPQNQAWIFNRLLALSSLDNQDYPLSDTDLVIWPESAIPFYLIGQPAALAAIADMLPEKTQLLTGALRPEFREADQSVVYNSIYQLGSDATILSSYDKLHLVPFGEYLPFQSFLERMGLEQLTNLKGGFAKGRKRDSIQLNNAGFALPLICYEIAFPYELLAYTYEKRPEWILNVTNDAWFGDSLGPRQHFHLARMRAVETGLPVVRVANTGISALIDTQGRVVEKIPLGQEGILQLKLPLRRDVSLFALLGGWIFGGVWLLCLIILVINKEKLTSNRPLD